MRVLRFERLQLAQEGRVLRTATRIKQEQALRQAIVGRLIYDAVPRLSREPGLNQALSGQRRSIRPSPATWAFALLRLRIW